jgi:ankyrin repeat protein
MLINSGAPVTEVTHSYSTAFHYIVKKIPSTEEMWKKHEEVMILLLREGADINARDIHMRTPLHRVSVSNEKVLRFLIENNAKINATDEYVTSLSK